jgi:hypothetical protein
MEGDYRLEGTVVETPDLTAWMMSRGEIGGIDISGLTVLMVRPGPVVILDERATPEQAQAVRDLFLERGSGFYLAPMTVRSRRLCVSIPERQIECRLTLPEPRRSR